MDQVSRPLQVVLGLVLAFAALWMVALRPKSESTPAPTTTPAAQTTPAKSAIPGVGGPLDTARKGAAQASADNAAENGRVNSAANGQSTPRPSASAGQAVAPGVTKPAPATSRAAAKTSGSSAIDDRAPAEITRALAGGRAVVLLFSSRGADDSAVRGELRSVHRRGGRVLVRSASINAVSRYGSITRGVEVLQAPTVIVVGPRGSARAFAGYTDSTEIDQAVSAALAR
jgi:hypothetical protein